MFSPLLNDYMPELQTQRLLLRKLNMNDAQDIYIYSRDNEVARYVMWYPHHTLSESRYFLRIVLKQYKNREPASYGIVLREENRVIGTIGFSYINQEHRCAEIGYSLSRAYWNKGLMTEALSAMIAHGFNDLNLNRIEAIRDVRNPASGKVMEKCGMTCEGIMKSKLYNKGEYIDVAMYSIVYDDFAKMESAGKY